MCASCPFVKLPICLTCSTPQGKGTVFAFDKDPARLARLVSNAQRAGATGVIHARCEDFLSLDTSAPEFAQVGSLRLFLLNLRGCSRTSPMGSLTACMYISAQWQLICFSGDECCCCHHL